MIKFKRVHARCDVNLAEWTSQHAELDIVRWLGAAQLWLENYLIAYVAVERKIWIFLVIIDSSFKHPVVRECAEATCLEVDLGRDVVRFVLFELQLLSNYRYIKKALFDF